MKKRIRKTGEIVDVIDYASPYNYRDDMDYVSYIDSNGVEHPNMMGLNINWDFEDVEEQSRIEINWEQRRSVFPQISKTRNLLREAVH